MLFVSFPPTGNFPSFATALTCLSSGPVGHSRKKQGRIAGMTNVFSRHHPERICTRFMDLAQAAALKADFLHLVWWMRAGACPVSASSSVGFRDRCGGCVASCEGAESNNALHGKTLWHIRESLTSLSFSIIFLYFLWLCSSVRIQRAAVCGDLRAKEASTESSSPWQLVARSCMWEISHAWSNTKSTKCCSTWFPH